VAARADHQGHHPVRVVELAAKEDALTYFTQHWSFDPFMIIVVVLVIWHEIGLARLAKRSRPERTRQRRLRSFAFYGGLAVLLLAVQSPIDYWADDYFFMHMIQHLLLMFAAPSLIVWGAPWQPLLDALPGEAGKSATRQVMRGGWSRPVRAVGGFFLRPWVSVILFIVVMLFWHIPGPYDLAERNQTVHIWLMHSSFFLAGVLFWLQFIPSPPFRITMKPAAQAFALLVTNVVMWLLAMSMAIFSSSSWYSVYNHIPGVTLPAFADQQIGAGILWVCGDFWAIPCMIMVMRKLIAEDGSVGAAVDQILGRGSARYRWANRA
jgi:putative membrane protein